MRKLIAFLLLSVIIFTSCNKVGKNEFRVNGNFTNGNNKVLYLFEMTPNGFQALDTINIDGDGSFKFKHDYKEPTIYVLSSGGNDYITFIPSAKEDIELKAQFNALSSSYTIKNSPQSQLLHDLNQEYIKTNSVLNELKQTLHDNKFEPNIEEIKKKLFEQYNLLELHQREYIKKFLSKNKGSISCIIALYRTFDNHYLFSLKNDLDVYVDVYNELNKIHPNNPHTIGLKTLIEKAKKEQNQAQELASQNDKK